MHPTCTNKSLISIEKGERSHGFVTHVIRCPSLGGPFILELLHFPQLVLQIGREPHGLVWLPKRVLADTRTGSGGGVSAFGVPNTAEGSKEDGYAATPGGSVRKVLP